MSAEEQLASPWPAGACDTHAHVIAASGYALSPARHYTPAPAPEHDYLAMLDRFGFTYGVLVQISVYGTDNRYLLEVLRRHPDRLRGIAVIDSTAQGSELQAMHQAGIRGVRINALYGAENQLATIEKMARQIAPLGWHIQLYANVEQLHSHFHQLASLPCPLVLDHMGHIQPGHRQYRQHCKQLLDLARHEHVWVKLSAANRLGSGPEYTDVSPIAMELIDKAPDRLVWGSDWPHVACEAVETERLVRLFQEWTPDERTRKRILVDNPAWLYGFPQTTMKNPN